MEMVRDYRPLNTEKLMRGMNIKVQRPLFEIEPIVSVEKNQKPPSPARRRRQSLLDDVNNKYAYSKKNMILHDRDCELVQYIKDGDFRMTAELDTSMTMCQKCYRKALIRSAVGDDRKRLNLYVKAFEILGYSNKRLKTLFLDHGAKLLRVDINSVTIKVHDDTWILRYYRNMLELYHNNYIVNDDFTRTFTQQFHLQRRYDNTEDYTRALCEMESYSWDNHLQNTRIGAGADYIDELKSKFSTQQNYVQTRECMFNLTFQFIDYNFLALRLIAEQGIVVNIRGPLPCCFIGIDEPYTLLQCRIKKKDFAAFETVMKKLKDICFGKKQYEYIEVCQSLSATN